MVCFTPLKGWMSIRKNLNTGKRQPVFDQALGHPFLPVSVKCGQCYGCRLDHSKSWAIRIIHESKSYENNSFLTLTYKPEKLPQNRTLVKEDFQNFMKNLRRHITKENLPGVPEEHWKLFNLKEKRVRYFHAGEYGSINKRPHYHACLFNYDFSDKKFYKKENDNILWISDTLKDIWDRGYCTIGSINFDSAAYVARYIMKKITGKKSDVHYVNKETGELREKEYTTMSRKPGLGKDWIEKYMSDVYPEDVVIVKGMKLRPPKYYDDIFDRNTDLLEVVKKERVKYAHDHRSEYTPERLKAKEAVLRAKTKVLRRPL